MTDKPTALQVTDAEASAVAIGPRVSLADIQEAISAEYSFVLGAALSELGCPTVNDYDGTHVLTLHAIVMRNGFVVIGKSAPASPENFNAELGAKFAKEDAMRQLWPLMGFSLRDRLQDAKFQREPLGDRT
jgi:hypothetical protein